MSSVMDDDDSSMMMNSATKLKLKRNQTDVEDNNEDGDATNMNPTNFDELSNDNSNFASSKSTTKRTGFKNLFVEQVIGNFLKFFNNGINIKGQLESSIFNKKTNAFFHLKKLYSVLVKNKFFFHLVEHLTRNVNVYYILQCTNKGKKNIENF